MVIPLALLIVPLVGDPSATFDALVHQRAFKSQGYITPAWNITPSALYGIWRLAPILVAVALAWWCARHRETSESTMLWGLGVAFALRTLEPAFNPYYAVPALVLFVLASTALANWRFVFTVLIGVWLTSWLNSPIRASWTHWAALLAQVAVMAALANPSLVPKPTPRGTGGDSQTSGAGEAAAAGVRAPPGAALGQVADP